MPKPKFYAVRVGREGPKIYDSWIETEKAVRGFPSSRHKSFQTKQEAKEWLDAYLVQPQPNPIKLTEKQILKRLYTQYDIENDQQATKKQNVSTSNYNNNDNDDKKNFENLNEPYPTTNKKNSTEQEQKEPYIDKSVSLKIHTPSNLSADQANVFKRVSNGRSVFFTGSAGTGKSYLIKLIIKHLKNESNKKVYVTASTGIAASLINGTTLHSFAGLGLANEPVQKLIWKLRNSSSEKRWISTDVLIIDEVSMIDGNFFDKLNEVAKSIRDCSLPFGGIQLILTGDFFQLPPVTKAGFERVPYIFETFTWSECIHEMLVLKHVFRQSDQAFVDLLDGIRYGQVSQRTIQVMKSLEKEVHYEDGILPAELYPTQNEVRNANNRHLIELKTPQVVFKSIDRPGERFTSDANILREKLDKNTLVSEKLILKVGAQVMLVKNLPDDGLVNGSIGIITTFIDRNKFEEFDSNTTNFNLSKLENDHQGWPKVLFTNGRTKVLTPLNFDVQNPSGDVEATRVQIPLILAWALSIHKSQGQSLERVKVNLARSFEAGQVYVALSRATSLKALQVRGFREDKVKVNKFVLNWAQQFLK